AREVDAEGLLHDDARSLDKLRFGQRADRRERRSRGNAEVVETFRLATKRLLCRVDRRPKGGRASGERDVGELAGEVVPFGFADRPGGKLVDRAPRERAKAFDVQVIERYADDPTI